MKAEYENRIKEMKLEMNVLKNTITKLQSVS